jgi:hypothetical protein
MGVYDFFWWMFGWREMLKLSSQHFNRMGIVQINIGASLIIDTCKRLLHQFISWKISFARRTNNGATHRLARRAVTQNVNQVWIEILSR